MNNLNVKRYTEVKLTIKSFKKFKSYQLCLNFYKICKMSIFVVVEISDFLLKIIIIRCFYNIKNHNK